MAARQLVFVRYVDHVLYNRASASVMRPQVRKAVGWLVYECEQYITIVWDSDDEAPKLRGGDPKASGLVLLKSDILKLVKVRPKPLQNSFELNLNRKQHKVEGEYALQPKKRKTRRQLKKETVT
ncbi:MAG: hypothetical protein ACQCN3_09150 [Candidatus Bathyarchaeia archaeon]|jgi:hypothetical protein